MWKILPKNHFYTRLFSNLSGWMSELWSKQNNSKEKVRMKHSLLKMSDLSIDEVLNELKTYHYGLSLPEVQERLEKYGANTIEHEKPPTWYEMLLNNLKNPFILVLILLGFVSYFTEDIRATVVVSIMIAVSVLMRFIQEYRSTRAAEKLRLMVRTKATVKRIDSSNSGSMDSSEEINEDVKTKEKLKERKEEIPIEELVPGDIVYLTAGDMIPADVRIIGSKDLFISQSALTGESMPVEKYDINSLKNSYSHSIDTLSINNLSTDNLSTDNPLERNNLCFMGTSVVSGFGTVVVIATGANTYFGSLAKHIAGFRAQTNFDKGINNVTWILIRVIALMVPIIFVINGLDKGNWKDAFLFSIAVAVGLTPEMLPMIVTANLAKGAVAMSRFKVIVKRLNSIQSFGAMDILCTDKTGTLTQDKIILERYLDIFGDESLEVLEYGFLNSYYQSGLKNMLDRAILDHANIGRKLNIKEDYKKIDEIPFDFVRKRLSVIVQRTAEQNLIICKGSVDGLIKVSPFFYDKGKILSLTESQIQNIIQLHDELSCEGFRVIAVGYKTMPAIDKPYTTQDESNLIFLGLMAFLDPPKETSGEAIKILKHIGVQVKVLTGDNEIVTRRVCKEVNLSCDNILLGSEIEEMSDAELSHKVRQTQIFARLTPLQKSRIINSLKEKGHIVGFLGDGINDAAGLRDSDVGISVDTATDIARESADIILLEKNLLVLGEGVIKGREVYGNIIKYIKMTVSSNFGNVLSVLIASALLPFLPMLPLQILIQNLLYDFSQISIPWDQMDKEFLRKPRTWDPSGIMLFMVCIGPISSIFDMTTFWLLWHVYGANSVENQALFQTGWFVEGLLSQTMIVHMIRTRKIPFIQSIASLPVIITTLLIMGIGLYLPFSRFGAAVQLVPLPDSYFIWLLLTLLAYCVLTQFVKIAYIKKFKTWL